MKMFSLYVEGICGADELFAIMEDVFRHIDEFEQFKSFCLSRECNRRKYTWFCRNPDDINMKDCTRIDHSYTTIPDDFPQSVYTGQKGTFCQQVLNHIVVSVPQGSESSFTFKAKNKHEESLFKIEDERYEIDQAINLNNDVIQVLEKANEQLKDYEGEYELDPKLFTKARVSWIYQMWAKNVKMINLLQNHPAESIPIILNTMKSFQADFKKKRDDMQNNWRQECNKHWWKSLDHKNFNFRLNEKKTQVAKEFIAKLKQLMDQSKILSDPEKQRAALEFYTGFEGQEVKSLDLKLGGDIDPTHPMLIQDPIYLEHFKKLPQFRFLLNDQDCLKLVVKFLYVCIDNQTSQNQKQKDFLITFSKYFLHLGFVQKNLEGFKAIEMPEELIDLIKNSKDFYQKYIEEGFKTNVNFDAFFFEKDKEVIVNIGTTRTDSEKEVIPLRSTNGILESDPEEDSHEEGNSEKESTKAEKPYLYLSPDQEIHEQIKNSRFLPPFQKDQILFFGSKNYYAVFRFFVTLYERLKLARNVVATKLRADIKVMKTEHGMDVTKLEEDFDKLEEYRFK